MDKQYDQQQALNPGQEQQQGSEEIDFNQFVNDLPEQFRQEVAEALVSILSYIHSDEGTTAIIQALQDGGENISKTVGTLALQSMDIADGEHGWSDSAKVFAGYFAVTEICNIAREAQILDIPKEQEEKIFKQAAQNYLYHLVKSKPTKEAREKEAIRIQKEVEPLLIMHQEQQQGKQGGLVG